jgi:hypothetical protein
MLDLSYSAWRCSKIGCWERYSRLRGENELRKEKLYNMHSSNIIWVIKLRRMRRARHVNLMGRAEIHKELWKEDLKEWDNLKDLGIDGVIIYKSLRKYNFMVWRRFIWLGIWKIGGIFYQRKYSFGFQTLRVDYGLAWEVLVSQGLCFMNLFICSNSKLLDKFR